MTCLAQLDPRVQGASIPDDELTARLAMYQEWYDGSALRLPDHAQRILGDGIEAARQREKARADDPDRRGPHKPGKAFRVMHEDGYRAVNERREDPVTARDRA